MDKTLAEVLGSDVLPAEMLETLQAAFDTKLKEMREDAELSIREEFAARYEHDKTNLIKAVDMMLTGVVKEAETSKAKAVAKLSESKHQLDLTIAEAKKLYKSKLAEHVGKADRFVTHSITKKIKELTEAKAAVTAKGKQLDETFERVKADMLEAQAARLKKIDEFAFRQIKRELSEFEQDHRALVETRVKLVSESKQKLAETQKRFVKEAAKTVEEAVNVNLKREMGQLHEDLERNRQNMFGRRIFEAVAAEFMTSYLAEGTEIRKLQNTLESKEAELATAKTTLAEATKAHEAEVRKSRLAEDRAARTKVMTELLSSLRGDKRSVMESMLEATKTEHLRAAFDRLLPVVLNEGARKPQAKQPILNEARSTRRVVSVTGDKANRLAESVKIEAEAEMKPEIDAIMRLAGISK